MASTRQAEKRAEQAECHRQRNTRQHSVVRTAIKRAVTAIESKDKPAATAAFAAAQPIIDAAVNKKLIHKNQAARHKSRLNARIKALSS